MKRDRYSGPQFPKKAQQTASEVITTTSKLIVPENLNRIGLYLWNASGNSCYITLGASGNSSDTVCLLLGAWSTWVMPMPIYRGAISGIRNSGTGRVIATELLE